MEKANLKSEIVEQERKSETGENFFPGKKRIFSFLGIGSKSKVHKIWQYFAEYPFYRLNSTQGVKYIFSVLNELTQTPCHYLYLLRESENKLILERSDFSELTSWAEKHGTDKTILEDLQEPEISKRQQDSHLKLQIIEELGVNLLNIPLRLQGEEFIGVIQTGPVQKKVILKKLRPALEIFSVAAASAIKNLKKNEGLLQEIQRLNSKMEVSRRMLGSALELNRFVDLLLDLALTATKAEAGFVAITNTKKKTMSVRAHKNLPDGFIKNMNLSTEQGLFEWSVDDSDIMILRDYEFVEKFHIKSILAVPLVERKTLIGVFALINFNSSEMFSDFSLSVLTNFVEQIKLVLNNSKIFEEFTERYFNTLIAMSRAYDHRSPYTAGHSKRVSEIAAEIATQMKLAPDQITNIRKAGLIHDVGMCGVVDIGEGYQADFNHPEIGASMIEVLPISGEIPEAVKSHHEWFDGWGFPQGLKADQIPIGGRILAVAEFFAEVTANSRVKEAASWEKLMEEFQLRRKKQFDPDVVDRFIDLINQKREKSKTDRIEWCWKFKGEPEDVCDSCPAYQQKERFCWSFPEVNCEKHGDRLCDNCFIYQEWLSRIECLVKEKKIEEKIMDYKVQQNGDVSILSLTGEIDVSVAPQLRSVLQKLIDAGQVKIVIDLGNVAFIDSSGLGIFVVAYKSAKANNGDIKFAAARPEVLKVIKLTRLDKHFELFKTTEEAEKSFSL